MKLKKSFRHNIAYAGVVLLLAFLKEIPLRSGIELGRLLALVFYAASKKHRKNTIRHLTMAFGDERTAAEIRRIARHVFLHFATAGVDAIRIPIHIKKDLIYEIERFEPICYIDTGDKEKDIITFIQKCSDVCAQMIRQHPEQWPGCIGAGKSSRGIRLKRNYACRAGSPADLKIRVRKKPEFYWLSISLSLMRASSLSGFSLISTISSSTAFSFIPFR